MAAKQKTKKVVIQGGYGAFHEIAAMHYFKGERIEIIPAVTFKDLFHSVKMKEADLGIMAIENSLAGSILPNYKLLEDSKTWIIGEIYLRIKQNLVALPGQKIGQLKEIYSHPVALLQCQKFFDRYPGIKLIDSADTAMSAQEIAVKKLKGVGAIASKLAAKMYKLEVLAESIETSKQNYTRFLILSEKSEDLKKIKNPDKASITFDLSHKIGSLSKILSILSYHGINLTKIQSMPIIGKNWEYQFYTDLTFDDYKIYTQALQAIKPFSSKLIILGEYHKGKTVIE
jgi:prephenate dehydratase